jgi:hypothetical protein
MTEAMNRTEITAPPRMNRCRPTQKERMTGMALRRPSARRMPRGSEVDMPKEAMMSVMDMPPHWSVGTCRQTEGVSQQQPETDEG